MPTGGLWVASGRGDVWQLPVYLMFLHPSLWNNKSQMLKSICFCSICIDRGNVRHRGLNMRPTDTFVPKP